jgi:hypothetical protein
MKPLSLLDLIAALRNGMPDSCRSSGTANGRDRELTASGKCRPTSVAGPHEIIALKRPLAVRGKLMRKWILGCVTCRTVKCAGD